MAEEIVRFVHISDSHIGPGEEHCLFERPTQPGAERVVSAINALPFNIDFVVHSGDIAAEPEAACYRQAAQVFSRLKAPIYYAVGNHDSRELIAEHLLGNAEKTRVGADLGELSRAAGGARPEKAPAKHPDIYRPRPTRGRRSQKSAFPGRGFEPLPLMGSKTNLCAGFHCYSFECGGIRFLGLDCLAPPECGDHGLCPPEQLAMLEQELQIASQPLALFLHFPPLELDSAWLSSEMRCLTAQRCISF